MADQEQPQTYFGTVFTPEGNDFLEVTGMVSEGAAVVGLDAAAASVGVQLTMNAGQALQLAWLLTNAAQSAMTAAERGGHALERVK